MGLADKEFQTTLAKVADLEARSKLATIERKKQLEIEAAERKKQIAEDYELFKAFLPEVADFVEHMKDIGTPVAGLSFSVDGLGSFVLR